MTDSGIRFCESCGSPVEPGARVCSSCGQPVSGAGTTANPQEVSAQSWSAPSAAPPKREPGAHDRWGSPQPEAGPDSPARWGSPQSPARVSPAGGGMDVPPKRPGRIGGRWLIWVITGLLVGCLCVAAVIYGVVMLF